jgi:hypothetical protein
VISTKCIDRNMVQAYMETEYRVEADPPLILKIGQAHQGLAALHREHQVQTSVFITAWNPFSRKHPEADNNARHAAFKADLDALELVSVPGIGQHPSNEWKGEPSLLVLGISRQLAMDLGERLEQNAIVWCRPDAVPELVLLR